MTWDGENSESVTTPDQELAWILRFKDGDQHGFLKILHRFEKPVINFAFRYLKDRSAAEDVAQEVFMEVFRNAQKFRPSGKLSTWIFKIAYNRCLDLLRRKKIVTFFSLESWFSTQDEESKNDIEDTLPSSPLGNLEKSEFQKAVAAALASLPATQRAATLLAKYEDLPLEEVGRIMGISVGAVKQLIFRAKSTLKETLRPLLSENLQK